MEGNGPGEHGMLASGKTHRDWGGKDKGNGNRQGWTSGGNAGDGGIERSRSRRCKMQGAKGVRDGVGDRTSARRRGSGR
jgi:hypothetical protein